MNIPELKILAQQLACPTGEAGIEIAGQMYRSNGDMIRRSIDAMMLTSGCRILEIGHGNGAHLGEIFSYSENLHYTGLEISQTMSLDAKHRNQDLYARGKADFLVYDGEELPFEENAFERLLSVNTVYFWKQPQEFLHQMYRILNDGGLLTLCFITPQSMERVPFTAFGFRNMETEELEEMCGYSNFRSIVRQERTEHTLSKTGDPVTRTYIILNAKK